MAKSKNNILKIENLSVNYGCIRALREVNLEIDEGELVALIGANGAGKSTLINTAIGTIRALNGSVWFIGKDITNKAPETIVAAGISVVPEGKGVFPLMTVLENLQLGAYVRKGNIMAYVEQIFNRFSILADRKNQLAGALSGGQQQLLSIARALMSKPKLLILDEPSLGLAPLAVNEVFNLIEELKMGGQTILLSEQNAFKALKCADRAYVFETGSIKIQGIANELINSPNIRHAYMGVADHL